MRIKALKGFTAVILTLILCLGHITPVLSSGPGFLSIDKTYLRIGSVLKVDHSEGMTLEYFVGERNVGSGPLVLTEDCLEKWITVKGYDGSGGEYGDKAYFSRLPVLYIDTDDSRPVISKSEYKTGKMFVQNNDGSEIPEYDGKLQIKGRGNTSWNWPKKPYRIKLDKKADLFGMGANKNWVLISNYLDECFLRNKTAYDLSGELGLEYMDSTWCDVVFNGEYVGNYLLCEHIRIDETRVDIFDWESEAKDVAKAIVKAEKKNGNILDGDALEEKMKSDLSWITTGAVGFDGAAYYTEKTYDDISGGYLFELSSEYDEVSKFTTENGLKVMLKSPEYLNTNPAMMTYVERYWKDLETAWRSEDGYAETDRGRLHWSELADSDSLVSYWLVMEIMGNEDAARKSRYAYMDMDSPMKFGPVWDFDWGCGSSAVSFYPTGWKATGRNFPECFFNELVDDPYFAVKATEKYWEIRPYLDSVFEDGGILDGEISYLRESGAADGARWDRKETWPDAARGFERDAGLFKEYMVRRKDWLDVQFATDEKLISSTYSKYSANPYKKSDDMISFDIPGSSADTLSAHAPADAVIDIPRRTEVDIGVFDPGTVSLDVYVNGLYLASYEVSGGKASLAIPASKFTEDAGKKNVVSVIGKSADGATTYKNFCTVIVREKPALLIGDADGNGDVNMKDILLLRKIVAGAEDDSKAVFANADAEADDDLNMKDILRIRKILAGADE